MSLPTQRSRPGQAAHRLCSDPPAAGPGLGSAVADAPQRSLEICNVTSVFALSPLRGGLLVAALSLAGCSSLDTMMSGEKLDYRSQANKTQSLDVPPDLTQLARDGRYQAQTGVVSASNLRQGGSAAAPVAVVAPSAVGEMRIERQGNSRWLVTTLPPETVYPLLRSFWAERGFNLVEDATETGVMETAWAENRAKLPQDFVRATIGRVLESVYSTGERDKFRSRVERTATGSEIYISHKGLVEVFVSQQKDTTMWQVRPADPELEAEMLARLMIKLGAKDEIARSTVAKATPAAPMARVASVPATAAMELDEPFDRAWRRVGLSLDRSGFTVEDRDRTAGLYFVRYVDPKFAGKEEPNFFAKLFSSDKDGAKPQRYRVLVKANGSKSQVTVQNNQGAPDDSQAARQIVGRLIDDLR